MAYTSRRQTGTTNRDSGDRQRARAAETVENG